jgi:serine/threonine-protein kinase
VSDPATLRSVLKAISGDERVDWDATASGMTDADARSFLQELRVISQIAEAHAALPASSARVLAFRLAAGATWGALHIRGLIASGADGDVYRAYDERLQREVALKLLRRGSEDDQRVAHALEEARLLARVRHPNVVTVYGADVVDGVAGVWMDLIPGDTLQVLVARQGPFGDQEAAVVGAEICRGLAAIHHAGVIHRDIKAQNVMRETGGRVVVMDFSVSRNDAGDRSGLAGTPLYIAPELFTGAPASVSSDLYSVGVLLYHLVTGTYPASGSTVAEIARVHETQQASRLGKVQGLVPSPFTQAVDRALLQDPAARFASASEFEAALLAAIADRDADAAPRVTRRPRFWAAAILGVLLVAGATWQWIPRTGPSGLAGPGEARRWVLLSSFDNQTGDAGLDGVLEYALERELSASPSFRVASRARIDDMLQLMRRPVGSRIDRETAREVAVRDGNIGTVIDGRIERVGGTVVLSAAVIDVVSGAAIATVSEESTQGTALQPSIRELSNRLRDALGEASGSIRESERQLERVTTPSLTALRLYSESWAAGARDRWPAALTLAREAVQADSRFAAAHTWLAWALMRNQAGRDEFLAAAAQGEALSSTASDWERMWIRGSHFGLQGRNSEALAEFEALLRIRPDHFWAVNNLVLIHRRSGSDEKALGELTRLLELRPHDHNSLTLAFDTSRRLRRIEEAKAYANRIKARGLYNRGPSGDAWIFDAVVAWEASDTESLIRELQRLEGDARTYEQELRDAVLARTSMLWLAAGRPTEAASSLSSAGATADVRLARASIAYATGDFATARREALAAEILTVPAGGTNAAELIQSALTMWLVGRSGTAREARTLHDRLAPRSARAQEPQGSATVNTLAAEMAYVEGRMPEVVKRLSPQNGWNVLRDAINFRAAETLAEALARTGDISGSAKALERARASSYFGSMDTAYWQMRCQLRLAETYQQLGRLAEAEATTSDLQAILREAEPGFPLAERVKALLSKLRQAVTDSRRNER